MSINMLVFDFRNSERDYFANNKFDDFEISFYPDSLNEFTLGHLSQKDKDNTVILSVFVNSDITKSVIDEFKNLRIIATRSTGVNHIDLKACHDRHIAVVNVENYGATTVVQFTWGLIIAIIRNIVPSFEDVKVLNIKPNCYSGRDLTNLTVGIIGTGAIGAKMCEIANAFSMKICAYDFKKKQCLMDSYGVEYVDLQTLLKNSDVISLHVPLCSDNYHLISNNEFKMMKKTAYLINTARGELVDTEALYNALCEEKIAGAALDVLECEDVTFHKDDLALLVDRTAPNCLAKTIFAQKLSQMPNVIITPHIAYDTQDAVETILKTTFESIKDNLQGGHANRVN